MTGTAKGIDPILSGEAWNQPNAELAQGAIVVEHGGPIDLTQRMSQRGEVEWSAHTQGRGNREELLDRRSVDHPRAQNQQGSYSPRAKIVNGELEERSGCLQTRQIRIADDIEEGVDRRLPVPSKALGAKNPEASDQAHCP